MAATFFGALFPNANWFNRWTLKAPSLPAHYFSQHSDWGRWETRLTRYDLFWSYWTNSVYDSANIWAGQFRTLYALYKYTRGTYNPMYRLGEFWATTTWGGALDPSKQGGRVVQSAIPLITDDDAVRSAIGKLWLDSHWQIHKNMTARYGAVKGDVAIRIADDPVAGKIRMIPVNPDTIRWIQLDYDGNTLAYELWEPRWDPRYNASTMNPATPGAGEASVIYSEKCTLEGPNVTYETFLNNSPFGWYGAPQKWTRPYGFVPFVLHPHIQMHPGYFWGASEYQAAFHKAMEVDDLASKQHDHIRKATNPKWFLAGVQKPKADPVIQGADPSQTNTEPGRQETEMYYAGLGATALPMVFPVDNQFVSIEIQNQLTALEKDYPELRYDSARASGDASAKALREVRKSAEAKVHDRRAGYDSVLVRAQKMALAMGGIQQYPGYEPFKEGAYEAGKLDHTIGGRSVFLMDPLDKIEEEQALFTAWQTAKLAGWPDKILMERFDFSEEEKAGFLQAKQDEQAQELEGQMKLAAAKPAPADPAKPKAPPA